MNFRSNPNGSHITQRRNKLLLRYHKGLMATVMSAIINAVALAAMNTQPPNGPDGRSRKASDALATTSRAIYHIGPQRWLGELPNRQGVTLQLMRIGNIYG